jgi:hypothetical protein
MSGLRRMVSRLDRRADGEDAEVIGAGPSLPRFTTIKSASLEPPNLKLDAKHYQDEFVAALHKVRGAGFDLIELGALADAFVPARVKLVTSPNTVAGAPYLRAHDAFQIRPNHNDRYVVRTQIDGYDHLLLQEGMILTPSSGRNLGPIAYVGTSLQGFAMTDIMRIAPRDREDGLMLLCYLLSPTAQALIRRGRTGTSVDHLAAADVKMLPVPAFPYEIRRSLIEDARGAEFALDCGRQELVALERELHVRCRLGDDFGYTGLLQTFSTNRADLALRLDAAFHSPLSRRCREALLSHGGVELSNAANLRMLGRYKRYYVGRANGRPILSGRQLLQIRPVNLRYISDRSFSNPEAFVIKTGWTLFTCDGRSEEALGSPAYVMRHWDGWMASNHVMRAVPVGDMHPGFLYLAMRSPYVQAQLKARATGSVVDALDPDTVADVIIPRLPQRDVEELGAMADQAWRKISDAIVKLDSLAEQVERLLDVGKYGSLVDPARVTRVVG